jgi:hypothetical protein
MEKSFYSDFVFANAMRSKDWISPECLLLGPMFLSSSQLTFQHSFRLQILSFYAQNYSAQSPILAPFGYLFGLPNLEMPGKH